MQQKNVQFDDADQLPPKGAGDMAPWQPPRQTRRDWRSLLVVCFFGMVVLVMVYYGTRDWLAYEWQYGALGKVAYGLMYIGGAALCLRGLVWAASIVQPGGYVLSLWHWFRADAAGWVSTHASAEPIYAGRQFPVANQVTFSPSHQALPPAIEQNVVDMVPVELLPDGPQAMPIDEWQRKYLFSPDVYPHKACVGPTGSRKTTFMRACLARLGNEWEFVVLTFKPGDWPDMPIVSPDFTNDGRDLDCLRMAERAVNVFQEMARRNGNVIPGSKVPAWQQQGKKRILLISDDHSQLVAERKEMQTVIVRMLGIGRAAGVHVWLTDTERNVKAWGLEGRGEARDNLLVTQHEPETYRVHMGKIAANGQWKQDESWPSGPVLLDTSSFIRPLDLSQLASRAWSPGERAVMPSASVPGGFARETVPASVQTLTKDEQIAAWILRYSTRERARAAGCQFDNDEWTRVRTRLSVTDAHRR